MEAYKRPQNCKQLVVPELNDEIKESINSIQLKRDKRQGFMQAALIKAAIAVTEVTEDLLKRSKEDASLNGSIRKTVDALALMGHVHRGFHNRGNFN